MRHLLAAAFILGAPGAALADGHADATAGATAFARQCVTCHVVATPDGEVLAGRTARTGPNLYGLFDRAIGSVPDFRYSDTLVALGADGGMWTEETLAEYLLNPTDYLRTAANDRRARSRMAFQVRNAGDAADIAAYLAAVSE